MTCGPFVAHLWVMCAAWKGTRWKEEVGVAGGEDSEATGSEDDGTASEASNVTWEEGVQNGLAAAYVPSDSAEFQMYIGDVEVRKVM